MNMVFAAIVAVQAAIAEPGDGIGPDTLEVPLVTEVTVSTSGWLERSEHYDFSANFGR